MQVKQLCTGQLLSFCSYNKNSYRKWKYLSTLCLSFFLFLTTANAQTFDWAKGMGGSNLDGSYDVAVDGSGNVYMAGYFLSDTADFNIGGSGGTLINSLVGKADVFLAKYDAAGNFLWAKAMGGNSTDYGYSVAVDGSGNVYVTGYFQDTADFNPGGSGGTLTAVGSNDVFLAKYDTGGNFLWAKAIGGSSSDYGYGVAVDGSGNVYMTGSFSDTADFNPGGSGGTLTAAGSNNVFLTKYSASGSFLWAKAMGGSSADIGYAVAVDGSGNVYVTGSFSSATAEFNPGGSGGTLTNAGANDAFLAKYDTAGGFLWAKAMGGSKTDIGYGVAVYGSNNVYMTGRFSSSTADFNPGGSGGTLTNAGSYDVFLARYDTTGNFLWAKAMGGSGFDQGYGVAVDGGGNVYVTGYFNSPTIDFNPGGGGGTLTPAGIYDVFLAKYDVAGGFLWVKAIGGSKADYEWGIAVDGSGQVYGTGSFSDIATFDVASGSKLISNGSTDIYLVKFACNDTSSSYIRASLPCGENYTWNEMVYTTQGTYKQVFPSTAGCDSTVTLFLTFTPIDKPIINIDSFTLGVAGTYATYQWFKDGASIPGATDSIYTITGNGKYQVAVTDTNGCSATSDAYPVTNYTGITDVQLLAKYVKLYPNPATDRVYIQSPEKINVALTDIAGKTIREVKDAAYISLKDLSAGIYLLRITDQNGTLIKVVKEVKQDQ